MTIARRQKVRMHPWLQGPSQQLDAGTGLNRTEDEVSHA